MAAQPLRRPHREGPVAGGQGPGLGGGGARGWRSPVAKFLAAEEIRRATESLGAAPGGGPARGRSTRDRRAGAREPAHRRRRLGARRPRRLLGDRFPDVRLERGRGSLGPAAPPVHLARRGPRRRPRRMAQSRVRRGARRLGARRRLDPDQPSTYSSGCSTRSGSGRRRRPTASASCWRRSATARRRGGIAFGIDRIAALLAGRDSIRDAIAFPKTASGADPLTGAPAPVDARQLRELGIEVDGPRA